MLISSTIMMMDECVGAISKDSLNQCFHFLRPYKISIILEISALIPRAHIPLLKMPHIQEKGRVWKGRYSWQNGDGSVQL